jgi:hypothetical protein
MLLRKDNDTMKEITFSYFVRDHLLSKENQSSLSSFSFLQLSKKFNVANVNEG